MSDEDYCKQIDAQAAAKPSIADAILAAATQRARAQEAGAAVGDRRAART
jgi:hypothetical protein